MKITKKQEEALQNKNSEILKKAEALLDNLKYSVRHEDFLYAEELNIYKRIYTLNTVQCREDVNSFFVNDTKRPQFSCVYFKDGNINSFHISYKGYVSKEETFHEKSFWGGYKEIKTEVFDFVEYFWHPFVSSHDGIPSILYHKAQNTFVDFESFKKCIKDNESRSPEPIDYSKIEPIKRFVEETIIDAEKCVVEMKNKINDEIKSLDKDNNGILDVIEGSEDFITLFKKHQKKIIEVDKKYIQYFVKISNYLKAKRENLQKIFTALQRNEDLTEMEDLLGSLKNQIHTYEVVLVHSFMMITSIVDDDLIKFYEIFEAFDKLKMFKSDHEQEVSNKISEIGDGLSDLMVSINSLERNIVSGLNSLSYLTQEGLSELNSSLSRELQSIDSSIQANNLLNTIQTYQLIKINLQTKKLKAFSENFYQE